MHWVNSRVKDEIRYAESTWDILTEAGYGDTLQPTIYRYITQDFSGLTPIEVELVKYKDGRSIEPVFTDDDVKPEVEYLISKVKEIFNEFRKDIPTDDKDLEYVSVTKDDGTVAGQYRPKTFTDDGPPSKVYSVELLGEASLYRGLGEVVLVLKR